MRTKASKASKSEDEGGFEAFEGEDERGLRRLRRGRRGLSKAPSHHYSSDFSNKEIQKTKEDSRGWNLEEIPFSLLSDFSKDEIRITKKIRGRVEFRTHSLLSSPFLPPILQALKVKRKGGGLRKLRREDEGGFEGFEGEHEGGFEASKVRTKGASKASKVRTRGGGLRRLRR